MPARKVIDALQIQPPADGLLPTLRRLGGDYLIDNNEPHWQMGMQVSPENCPDSGVGPPPCSTVDWDDKDIDASRGLVEITPFTIWAGDKCSTMAGQPQEYYEGRAQRQLFATQSYQIAEQLWTGSQAEGAAPDDPTPYFDKSATADVIGAGLEPAEGLACAELYLARCLKGSPGVIHAPVDIASLWAMEGRIERDPQGNLRTILGTLVIADAGYPGTGVAGAVVAGSSSIFVSSPVRVRLEPFRFVGDTLAEVVNRSINDIEVRAERVAAAWFEGCCLGTVSILSPDCALS